MFNRATLVNQLKENTDWDVIVIGGGATGLGVALDSVSRGFKTLLLEQVDFAKGTSSRSTKLVHGGVRYLAQGNIDLVKEALYERGLMLKNAPHLVGDQSFIIPNYSWWDSFFYTIGLKVYDFLSGKLSFGKSSRISKDETETRLKTLKKKRLKGGVVYHDGQFDDSRLAINLAQTCIEHGATVLNHFKVTNLLKNDTGKICGVQAVDSETKASYTLNSRAVINATGVFTDDVLKMDNAQAKDKIRPSQGVHVVLDKSYLPGNDAIMIPKTKDGRVLFLVPWHNRVVVGTTDTLMESHSLEPKALSQEVEFIIETANAYLTKPVGKQDVLSIFAGLRPLAAPKDNSEKTKEISRSHKIIKSKSGLITITGGKWTTYRRMAQDTINRVIKLGKLPNAKCITKTLLIHGADGALDKSEHLYVYGSDKKYIIALIKKSPELGEKLHERLEFTKAEVVWAIRNEMARTLDDVLARRVRVLFLDAKVAVEIAPVVASILATELGRNEAWEKEQIASFTKIASHYIL
ncbi:glycerol-3-phosphate dehydrogenase/oxidase [Algibacter amylolyticus]|uniref:Glycerol-3-phosphate dehydrogenase/oxidase n=1 Tax=Algibacter amylolyticus TaxID=1608400 RepID=A0A5M7BEK8_9FLAO|nr:glycerol-3-phosphate dehydrogenase/oxidase [Algibacter amylolyticus]KAA5828006.1 glycerol-3-phosphate dehydrogenase/oxidase [Algibacter amylolyticus]MBB5267249.1 glycerol-3-phosphate dehydrogenase [Algibacter amylolyticus]TSJ82251.1 glycerol-3-phosphate dehydrogenase/oxidase [Algibacter amylolyticus]